MAINQDEAKTGCPGVTEVRPITSRLFGIRVRRGLINKLKGAEEALRQFKEIVAKAGLGSHFGMHREG
jgi:hypothetical protein